MLNLITSLFVVLSTQQRKKLLILQLLVLVMAFTEMLGVALVGPFVASFNSSTEDNWFYGALAAAGIDLSIQGLGVSLLLVLLLSSSISMYVVWRLSLYAQELGADFSVSLFRYYLKQPWLYHTKIHSSFLIKQIATEANRVTGAVLFPIMQLIAKSAVILVISFSLFLLSPIFSVFSALFFMLIYSVLFRTVRAKLAKNGRVVSDTSSMRLKLMTEGFGGVKNILVSNKAQYFIDLYEGQSKEYGVAQGTNLALSQVPRYFMEFLALGGVVAALLFILSSGEERLLELAPLAAVYGFAGLKMLPAFQQVFAYLAQIKGNTPAFKAVQDDLLKARAEDDVNINETSSLSTGPSVYKPSLKGSLELIDICFRYPDEKEKALDAISINIRAKSIVALVGSSGAGKSTLVDIILGLVDPESGDMRIDGLTITNDKLPEYRSQIGYVPQKIFLNDCSIAENIAFGIDKKSIDQISLARAVKLARVDEFVGSLPEGLDTIVGEGGVQFSGGQQQRIGIARALYHNPSILVFDEATSALDNMTEKNIMSSLLELSKDLTIIMVAHRLSTVMNCDEIYFMDAGKILDIGRYEDLMTRCEGFRNMALAGSDNAD